MSIRKIHTIVGARPQFVKAAAVSRAMAQADDMDETIIHTGQHYDANMSDVFFDELGIPKPGYHLTLGGGTHGAMTGRMLEEIEKIFLAERPDMVMIYGDTNSTLAGALAAAKLHIPIAHVEAGLRSYNRKMPEEINRVMSDHVSALLLCPTQLAVDNLVREGLTQGVSMIGDVMYDATLHAIEKSRTDSTIIKDLGLEGEDYAVLTLHRAENTDDEARFAKMMAFIEAEAEKRLIIFPIHPRTRKVMAERGITPKGVRIIDPLGYIDLHGLMLGSSLILTDSGGLQKEAYFHKTPCITLRDETEWVETLESGWNRLWTQSDWSGARGEISDYGNGQSGDAVVRVLREYMVSMP